jgi:uncharacterized protein (DUF1501 family)
MSVTRREFVTRAGAAAALSFGWSRMPLLEAAAEAIDPASADGRSLVVIQLAGGNDGLNTVVPYADPLYRKLRPSLGLPESELLRIDDALAFHSALAPLRERFGKGEVAVVQGVGYPKPDRSHFVSTAIWQTARLEPYKEPTGWLGRAVESAPDAKKAHATEPLEALSVGGGGLTPALYAQRCAVPSLLSLEAFTVQADRRYPGDAGALRTALGDIYGDGGGSQASAAFLRQVGGTALKSSEALKGAVAKYASSVSYPGGGLGTSLKLVAQILSASLGTRLVHVTLGGFDTHANQRSQQRTLLAQLAEGIDALLQDLKAHGLSDRVAVMTYSEFGRRVQENASGGTDHGAASVVFVVGEKVAGGLHGKAPDLADLQGGDVPFAVDFRAVYASVLRDWMGVVPEPILGSGFGGLRLFRS